MSTESFFGELSSQQSDGLECVTSVGGPESVFVRRIASQFAQLLAEPSIRGVFVATGGSQFYIDLIEQGLPLFVNPSQTVTVACSRYSQQIELGALLFLLAGAPPLDIKSDLAVFGALRAIFNSKRTERPVLVVVDNATMLDSRSETVLSQLLSAGSIRLILLANRTEHLGSTLRSLVRHRALDMISQPTLSRQEVNLYLEALLTGTRSPGVHAYYWAKSRGNMQSLQGSVREDLDVGRLVDIGGVWVIHDAISLPGTDSAPPDACLGVLGEEERRLLTRIISRGSIGMAELARSETDLSVLDGLLDRGLVRREGPGAIVSTANNIGSMLSDISKAAGESNFLLQPHAELLVAVDEIAAGCYISARGRLESVELQKETSPLDKEQLLVFELAKWSASLGTNNFEAASAQWATNGSSHHFLSRDGARAEQIRVLGWYCTIRRGELAAIPFSADSEDGIWACVRDFGWTDSLNRVLGVLCVAHTWVLEGHADKGQKLLKWALQEVRRVGALSLDHRYQLLLPSIAFLAHTVAFQLNDWNAASEVDAIVLDGAHSDAAAEKYVAYFACLRALTLGDMDIAAHLVNVLKVEEHLAGAQVIDGMTRCIDWAIGASQGSHVESEGLRQLSSPEILTTNSWCVAQLALLVRAGIDPNEQLLNDLYSMVRRALAQGLRYAAAETLSVMLALGHPVDEGLLAEIDANTNSQLVGLMEELNRALMGQNRDEELRVRFELAALGQREHVALLLRSQENTNVVVRRRAQRALVQGNGHLGRFDPSGRNARNERGERETSNWVELLTSREQTIAGMAAKGMRNLEIAKKCSISVRTVEGHLYQVHSKLNVRNRHGLKRLLQPATGGGEG